MAVALRPLLQNVGPYTFNTEIIKVLKVATKIQIVITMAVVLRPLHLNVRAYISNTEIIKYLSGWSVTVDIGHCVALFKSD